MTLLITVNKKQIYNVTFIIIKVVISKDYIRIVVSSNHLNVLDYNCKILLVLPTNTLAYFDGVLLMEEKGYFGAF